MAENARKVQLYPLLLAQQATIRCYAEEVRTDPASRKAQKIPVEIRLSTYWKFDNSSRTKVHVAIHAGAIYHSFHLFLHIYVCIK